MTTRWMTIWLAFALALPLWLRAASVTAAISDQQIAMGDTAQFQVVVSDADTSAAPDIEPLQKDFVVGYLGPRRFDNTEIINGRVKRESGTAYTYSLVPRRAGTLPIPSLTVKADGKVFQTPSGEILVTTATDSVSIVEMVLPSRPVYVGEMVPVTIRWLAPVGMDIREVGQTFILPSAPDGSQAMPISDPSAGKNVVNIAGLRGLCGIKRTQEKRDGRLYTVRTLSAVLQPRTAGTIVLSAPQVRFQVPEKKQRRTRPQIDDFPMGFDSLFDQQTYRYATAIGSESRLEVKPLPAEGRPAGFFGLVAGKVSLATAATPQAVRVGDPVTLSVMIGPAGLPAETMKKLDLRKQAALGQGFKLANEADEGQATDDGFMFSRTIRPLNANVKEIPAIEIPYFDAQAGEYRVARSQPIPLSVEGVKQVALAEVGAATGAPAAMAAGLAANAEGPQVLADQRVGLAVWRGHVDWLVCASGALLVWMLVAWLAWQRRQAGAAERALERRTLAVLRNELKKDDATTVQLQEAFLAWLGARLRLPPGTLTFADLETRGLGNPEVQAVFMSFDLMRYGGAAAISAAEIRIQVERALAALENHNGGKEERP